MKHSFSTIQRVLAIDPYSRGFGFAVIEEPLQLVGFGLKIPRVGKDRNTERLKRVERIIDYYQPDVLVVEDHQSKESRRWQQAKEILCYIEKLVSYRNVEYVRFARSAVYQIVTSRHASTKHSVAVEIAKRFPELESYLPRPRKAWMSEDETMNIFDAIALALTFFGDGMQRPAKAAS